MKRKHSLTNRAHVWAWNWRKGGSCLMSIVDNLVYAYIAGYRAAQRDARKNRTEETNGDYPR